LRNFAVRVFDRRSRVLSQFTVMLSWRTIRKMQMLEEESAVHEGRETLYGSSRSSGWKEIVKRGGKKRIRRGDLLRILKGIDHTH